MLLDADGGCKNARRAMTIEVTITAADYWASRPVELAQLLATCTPEGGSRAIPDPSGRPPDPEKIAVVVSPAEWALHPRELQEALAGAAAAGTQGSGLASGAIAPVGERLTLTVEEAATLLGISRAFAYEAVNRGEVPSIRIGRRILVPKTALHRLLAGEGQ
jgi:excisionase family DNA binding protein